MAVVTPVKVLTKYFNDGDGKRSIAAWRTELNEFTSEERHAFAAEVCKVTGDTLG